VVGFRGGCAERGERRGHQVRWRGAGGEIVRASVVAGGGGGRRWSSGAAGRRCGDGSAGVRLGLRDCMFGGFDFLFFFVFLLGLASDAWVPGVFLCLCGYVLYLDSWLVPGFFSLVSGFVSLVFITLVFSAVGGPVSNFHLAGCLPHVSVRCHLSFLFLFCLFVYSLRQPSRGSLHPFPSYPAPPARAPRPLAPTRSSPSKPHKIEKKIQKKQSKNITTVRRFSSVSFGVYLLLLLS